MASYIVREMLESRRFMRTATAKTLHLKWKLTPGVGSVGGIEDNDPYKALDWALKAGLILDIAKPYDAGDPLWTCQHLEATLLDAGIVIVTQRIEYPRIRLGWQGDAPWTLHWNMGIAEQYTAIDLAGNLIGDPQDIRAEFGTQVKIPKIELAVEMRLPSILNPALVLDRLTSVNEESSFLGWFPEETCQFLGMEARWTGPNNMDYQIFYYFHAGRWKLTTEPLVYVTMKSHVWWDYTYKLKMEPLTKMPYLVREPNEHHIVPLYDPQPLNPLLITGY